MHRVISRTEKIQGFFVQQPIGEFFVGIIPAKLLTEIAYADLRKVENIEGKHSGLNRPISNERVKEIRDYVQRTDATFPNTIIIAINSEKIVEQNGSEIVIAIEKDVAKIIDGQHRVRGLERALNEEKEAEQKKQNIKKLERFDLIVSVFVDLPIEDQAAIFSTINLKQTPVNKSLVYDLFELDPERSPQKTCHLVAKSMNKDESSPFFQRIKLLGRNPEIDGKVLYKAPLTQAAFIKYLLPMITDNAERDRELLKNKKPIPTIDNAVERGQVFRRYFQKEEDSTIIRILNNYFGAVSDVFPEEWTNKDNPLSKTVGYGALMRLLKTDLFPIGDRQNDLSKSFFSTYFEKAVGKITFDFDEYAPAGKGETNLYKDLKKIILEEASE